MSFIIKRKTCECFQVKDMVQKKNSTFFLIKGRGQIVHYCWFNILLISVSFNKNKDVVNKNNDVEPTMFEQFDPSLSPEV